MTSGKQISTLFLMLLTALNPNPDSNVSTHSTLFAQQEGTPLRHGRMSREEAQGKIEIIKLEINKGTYVDEYRAYKRGTISSLNDILERCDDREMLYRANYLSAKNSKLYNYEYGPFSYLEKCLFQYSEQERKFGLVSKAATKIIKELAERRYPQFTLVSKAQELYDKSPYYKKDIIEEIITRGYLNGILNQNIGGLPLGKAAEKIFENDKLFFKMEGIDQMGELIFYATNPPENTINLSENASHYYTLPYYGTVGLRVRNTSKPFPKKIEIPNTPANFDAKKAYANVNSFVREQLKKSSIEDIQTELKRRGFKVHKSEIVALEHGNFAIEYQEVRELYTKPGMTIKDFLILGGVDPYDWVYPSNEELIDW
jgi:hypothetical protein